MDISEKFQLCPQYSFWGVDFLNKMKIKTFGCHDNQLIEKFRQKLYV